MSRDACFGIERGSHVGRGHQGLLSGSTWMNTITPRLLPGDGCWMVMLEVDTVDTGNSLVPSAPVGRQ